MGMRRHEFNYGGPPETSCEIILTVLKYTFDMGIMKTLVTGLDLYTVKHTVHYLRSRRSLSVRIRTEGDTLRS
jgi:hypothetical protein